jgi:hypothetical protein
VEGGGGKAGGRFWNFEAWILFFWLYLPLSTFIHLYWDGVGLPQKGAKDAEQSIVGVQGT